MTDPISALADRLHLHVVAIGELLRAGTQSNRVSYHFMETLMPSLNALGDMEYALRQHAERGGWQPIETAPKDRRILICWGSVTSGPQGIVIGLWMARYGTWVDLSHNAIESDGYLAIGWRELPPPPTS